MKRTMREIHKAFCDYEVAKAKANREKRQNEMRYKEIFQRRIGE